MNIVIYNPNAAGGNFDYAIKLAQAYLRNSSISNVKLVLPKNAKLKDENFYKVLLGDQPSISNKWFSRFYFVWRSMVNPILFFLFLRKQSGYVIFNDFDQATSFFWVPFFRWLRTRFTFAVILHDPDRDLYFRNLRWSTSSMKKIMSLMDIAFYHEILPDRPYYKISDTQYVSVPHGLYNRIHIVDEILLHQLKKFKGKALLLGAIGNIRNEKNYSLLLQSMTAVPDLKLFIGGVPANTSIDMKALEHLMSDTRLQNRVLFMRKFLTVRELEAVAEVCDGFVMYYASTFKSQSGVLNLVAPFKKPLLISENDSPLSYIVKKFGLGLSVPPDSIDELTSMIRHFAQHSVPNPDWDGYFAYASWENHVNIAVSVFKQKEY